MSADFLRWLDRFIGIPLCALLTLFARPRQTAGQGDSPRDILFIQLAEAGSMVLADPTVAAVEQQGAKAWFVTFARNAPALALTRRVPAERIYVLRDDRLWLLLRDAWQLRRWVRTHALDAVVDLELFARLTAVLAFWTGARRRAGFQAPGMAFYRGQLYTAPVDFAADLHIAQNYLRLAGALFPHGSAFARTGRKDLRVRPVRATAAALARVDGLLTRLRVQAGGRLVLVNPNASERLPQRRWPAGKFATLIAQLLAIRPDVTVLLIGAPEDRATTRAIAATVALGRCIDCAGELALDALPALFERSSLLIGNDSGPAHFAAVSALPVIVLFGPETPRRFGPLGPATVIEAGLACAPCISPANQRKSACRDNQCMQRIEVAAVLDASLQQLQQGQPRALRHGKTLNVSR